MALEMYFDFILCWLSMNLIVKKIVHACWAKWVGRPQPCWAEVRWCAFASCVRLQGPDGLLPLLADKTYYITRLVRKRNRRPWWLRKKKKKSMDWLAAHVSHFVELNRQQGNEVQLCWLGSFWGRFSWMLPDTLVCNEPITTPARHSWVVALAPRPTLGVHCTVPMRHV